MNWGCAKLDNSRVVLFVCLKLNRVANSSVYVGSGQTDSLIGSFSIFQT